MDIQTKVIKALDKIADGLQDIVKNQCEIKKQNADILKELRLARLEQEVNEGF